MGELFCRNFSASALRSLLAGYDQDYPDLLLNIFELTLTNVLGSILTHNEGTQLYITPADRAYLQANLGNLSPDKLASVCQEALKQLYAQLNISEPFLQKYCAETVNKLIPRLQTALATQQLAKIFISFKKSPSQPSIQFDEGEKMDDDSFRKMADEIRACRYLADKIIIIKSNINSITDLVDLLEGSCFFGDEFHGVFRTLKDPEPALLLARLPKQPSPSDLHLTENEKEWHHQLTCFLKKMDPQREKYIITLAEKIVL